MEIDKKYKKLLDSISLSKSGAYISSILRKNPEFAKYLDSIIEKYNFLDSYPDALYFLKNNCYMPFCKTCGKQMKYIKIRRGLRYCSCKCRSNDPDVIEKTKQTCLEKYGVDNPAKADEIQNKIQATNIIKYNAISPLQNPIIREKSLNTLMERYGVDNSMKLEYVRTKMQNTMLQRYNAKFTGQSPTLMEKVKQTNLKKYNGIAPYASEEVLNKFKQTCLQRYGFDNAKKCETWNMILSWKDHIIPLFDKSEYIDKQTTYKWQCVKCGNIFEQKIYTTHFNKDFACLPRCINCYPRMFTGISIAEKELLNFCKMHFIEIEENNKNLIKPFELDIVVPELKLAIEFNGIFWHSIDNGIQLNYHLNKTEMCEQIGYRLIHIWEDEWNNNKEEIKQKLINIFTNNEIIDYSKPLDRCWHQAKQIEGYKLEIIPPEILIKNKFQIENCGYLKYTKLN